MKKKLAVASLLLANLFPVIGVLFFGWEVFSILFLYWFENIVIGFYNILKITKAEKANKVGVTITLPSGTTVDKSKKAVILFFITHYGIFTAVHGVFVFFNFSRTASLNAAFLLGVVSLFISHGISYLNNYIGKKEYVAVSPEELMLAPYKRVVIMHLTTIFGGMLVMTVDGRAVGPLIVLTLIKTLFDFFSHSFEHNKLIPGVNQNRATKVYVVPERMIKKFFPNYEKLAGEAYRKSVETGKWDELKATMDPETVKYIEDYWSNNTRK